MDDTSWQMGARLGLQLEASTGEIIEQAIRLDFLTSNNKRPAHDQVCESSQPTVGKLRSLAIEACPEKF